MLSFSHPQTHKHTYSCQEKSLEENTLKALKVDIFGLQDYGYSLFPFSTFLNFLTEHQKTLSNFFNFINKSQYIKRALLVLALNRKTQESPLVHTQNRTMRPKSLSGAGCFSY